MGFAMHYRALELECFSFCSFAFVNILDLVIRLKKRLMYIVLNVLLRGLWFTILTNIWLVNSAQFPAQSMSIPAQFASKIMLNFNFFPAHCQKCELLNLSSIRDVYGDPTN